VTLERRLERRLVGRPALIRQAPPAQAELLRDGRETGRQRGQRGEPRFDELLPELGDALRPGSQGIERGGSEAHAAESRVPLRDGGGVVGGKRQSGGGQTAEHAVEVGAAGRGPALHDGEAVGGEDQGLQLAPQLLGGREPLSVELRTLALTAGEADAYSAGDRAPAPARVDAPLLGAEANH